MKKELSALQTEELLATLKTRFEEHMHRHQNIAWSPVLEKLKSNSTKLWSLYQMEITGGAPDVVAYDESTGEYLFYDCAKESPAGRRSICYDHEALAARKENKPKNSALQMAQEMGIEILTEVEYRALQKLESFDLKTSSWVKTPAEIRKVGGALFCDNRYHTVFVYHNGAESYYAARGFRGALRV